LTKLRYFLKEHAAGITVSIRSGPLVGMRWGLFTSMDFIRGDYSTQGLTRFLELLRPGDVAYDIGAHVGYYALCAALKVGERGQVMAFEPLPLNITYLRNHLRLNGVRNVRLIEAGVSDTNRKARFHRGLGTGRGHLAEQGDYVVDVVSLDELCASGKIPPPDVIKMDIEGGETKALRGAHHTLLDHHPTVFVSLHGPEAEQNCPAYLASLGYSVQWIGRSDIVAKK
jgi:FkbM family methyltransferase